VVLDKGQENDWFSSNFIVTFTIITVAGMIAMIAWELWLARWNKKPILDLRLFGGIHRGTCREWLCLPAVPQLLSVCRSSAF
jgi:DHA2 family multidrug resistance protein